MKFYKMYLLLFGFIVLKFQISLSEPQFPPHVDLQKVGIAIFNNEKYNILKPTTHVVTDHFKDFMLRQDSNNTGGRIFIDKNGLRHKWSGFLDNIKSLRKTDLKHGGSFENVSENTLSDEISNDNMTTVENSTHTRENITQKEENENNNQEEVNNNLDNNETAQNSTEDATGTPESKETTTTLDVLIHGAHVTIEQRLRQGKKQQPTKPPPKKVPTTQKKKNIKTTPKKPNVATTKAKDQKKTTPKKPNVATTKATDQKKTTPKKPNVATTKATDQKKTTPKKPNVATTKATDQKKTTPKKPVPTTKSVKQDTKVRTVATTTFFCPFFGVLTMSAFID